MKILRNGLSISEMNLKGTKSLLKEIVYSFTEVFTSCFSERNFLGIYFLKKETVQ